MKFTKNQTAIALLSFTILLISNSRICGAVDGSPRQRTSIDADWKFTLGDVVNAQKSELDDSSWTTLGLPHDWSIEGSFDQKAPAGGGGGFLPTGIGWYRRVVTVPDSLRFRRVKIEFDGIYENSEVWLNGHSLGKRAYGYASFVYDLTPYLIFGGKANLLAVRVDNSPQPNSRWYSGSGIYRHAWLLVSDDLHIPQRGTFVTTPKVSADSATVDAAVQICNDSKEQRSFEVKYTIVDESDRSVGSATAGGSADAGATATVKQSLEVSHPTLWSAQKPSMYRLRCQVTHGDALVDEYETPFGIRTAVFDVNKGFVLNGISVKLNGVCLHSDGGGVGAAVPQGVWARRLRLLREMGCNAIRTSHNPPAPEFLDLCDRMGFMVMDEAFDEWEQGKRQNGYHLHFKECWQQDLTDFIRRDRNHPSVILWSAGNEIGEQAEQHGIAVLKELIDTFHTEDPTRPVTAACDRMYAEPKSALPEFVAMLDVAGYNYVDRWRDRADKYYSIDRGLYPARKFIGTENSSMAGIRGDYRWLLNRPATQPTTRGKYERPPLENTRISVEQLWKFVGTNDYVAGDFMWTGIDYLGESSWPNKLNTAGALDTCGFKKDGYYFYQSQWTSQPVLHVMPHWNLSGREDQIVPVTAYTNCDWVELFLNGKSYGVKGYEFPRQGMKENYGTYPPRTFLARTTSDLHLSWDVPYEPGTLKAVGSFNGQTITEEVVTTGPPAAIRLSVDKPTLIADSRDVAHITVEVVDDNGHLVPTADDENSFELIGPARLLSVDNGNPASGESFKANHRRAFNGMCLAIIQSKTTAGTATFTATAKGLQSATVSIEIR